MSLVIDAKAEAGAFLQAALAGDLPKIQAVMGSIVRDTFVSHPMRRTTQAEITRRTEIALRWYEKLRGDLHWPVDRVLNSLRSALVAELDGRKYEPDVESVMWAPDPKLEPVLASLRQQRVMAGPTIAGLN